MILKIRAVDDERKKHIYICTYIYIRRNIVFNNQRGQRRRRNGKKKKKEEKSTGRAGREKDGDLKRKAPDK